MNQLKINNINKTASSNWSRSLFRATLDLISKLNLFKQWKSTDLFLKLNSHRLVMTPNKTILQSCCDLK